MERTGQSAYVDPSDTPVRLFPKFANNRCIVGCAHYNHSLPHCERGDSRSWRLSESPGTVAHSDNNRTLAGSKTLLRSALVAPPPGNGDGSHRSGFRAINAYLRCGTHLRRDLSTSSSSWNCSNPLRRASTRKCYSTLG